METSDKLIVFQDNTNLSKVKIHRIVKRLEGLGIVSKFPYGMTNKIRLEKLKENK